MWHQWRLIICSSFVCSCVPYVPEPENTNLLRTSLGLYRKFKKYPEAMRCAIQLQDMTIIEEIFTSCNDMYVFRIKTCSGLCVKAYVVSLRVVRHWWCVQWSVTKKTLQILILSYLFNNFIYFKYPSMPYMCIKNQFEVEIANASVNVINRS